MYGPGKGCGHTDTEANLLLYNSQPLKTKRETKRTSGLGKRKFNRLNT